MMESQTLSLCRGTGRKKYREIREKKEEEIRQILEAEEHTFTSGFPHETEVFEM